LQGLKARALELAAAPVCQAGVPAVHAE